jgi:hypothetical protein
MSVTLGIDLSSQPTNTAICAIDWSGGGAAIVALWRGVAPTGAALHDEVLIAAMRGAADGIQAPTKVGIDAPLGWPVDFIRGVSDPANWPVRIDESRKRLERRATDHWVHETAGKQPLSVTTDRIAYPAMRAAGLLAHYEHATGDRMDRSGVTGLVCETYPDPAIRRFGIWPDGVGARQSYKGAARDVRSAIVDRLVDAAPWLAFAAVDRQRCIDVDDCLDAVICALTARAAERGETAGPPGELAAEAAVEGWIHLPVEGCLPALAGAG